MGSQGTPVLIRTAARRGASTDIRVDVPAYDRRRLEDVGFLTAMTLTLLGNYQQTGHFGGPLAYTPYNVALHLAGPENGGLCYDYRRPKHPFGDKLLLAGGHNIPTLYALWMIMGEAMARRHAATGDGRFRVDPDIAMLSIDGLGFRRGAGALRTLLADAGVAGDPLFAQAGLRGIRSLAGHSETTDLINDVNGGPSGIGIATAAGKAAFWDFMGAGASPKVVALEGEFAMTAGHAQELKRRPSRNRWASGCASCSRTTTRASTTRWSAGWCPTRWTATRSPISGPPTGGTCSRWRMATTTTTCWRR